MSELNADIIREWNCSCKQQNPLRYGKCSSCGKAMPSQVKRKIYREEIKIQKKFFDGLTRKKLEKREALLQKAWIKVPVIALPYLLVILLFLPVYDGEVKIRTIREWNRLAEIVTGIDTLLQSEGKMENFTWPEIGEKLQVLSTGGKVAFGKIQDLRQIYSESYDERDEERKDACEERINYIKEKKENIVNYVNGKLK